MTDDELDLIEAALDAQRANAVAWDTRSPHCRKLREAIVKVAAARVPDDVKAKFISFHRARLALPSSMDLGIDVYNFLMEDTEKMIKGRS